MKWNKSEHGSYQTTDFLFNQLIPYIGNKRKLLDLIKQTLIASQENFKTQNGLFIDCFAGTGVVSRLAKMMGYQVFCNDWEYYSQTLNIASIQALEPPTYFNQYSYDEVLQQLNNLPPIEDWVTKHLCPRDDIEYDISKERMFYMHKNGIRIDTIREKIEEWDRAGLLNPIQKSCLLAPLLYCACYHANTSGVFKGFHKGWGGQTQTALYRIAADLNLAPIQFFNNHQNNKVFRMDAQTLAEELHYMNVPEYSIAYLDPPYNQHPYGANYHVLNSITLWDKPNVSPHIIPYEKSAIRKDWRTERKSAYTIRKQASFAYQQLLQTLPTRWIATSYSTDGFINLREMIEQNCEVGEVKIFAKPYKRYRVSAQRYSEKAHNIEFVLLTKVGEGKRQSSIELVDKLHALENDSLTTTEMDNHIIHSF
ncbi:Adenine-specific DNA methylase [Commensalibacter communis]|uniref:site-specific DNA-methyltransferase (adenine-specific) n=1 Tax=Commensalibacter communis TaxID=2972786 RepID=A0A9W4TMP9_9PROT|nr:DNA adenine methylase [Commensalibacter communis]CAI3923292.1 Adenine-specific DNA methylase [Commensalibacter communis]CAI3923295.1 Adenine-specific DNA methylase [Commensalibacter communis]CAI3930056.1 Adenine-specific DNA methylase [Commensalibacter communis]CAI3930873.1 Adenine-specific DNA methylase [Commensalibacter communis]CAI3931398.1 Adenine-specific DNA methylase [Commensalibacter communis]